MKKIVFTLGLAMAVSAVFTATEANAQLFKKHRRTGGAGLVGNRAVNTRMIYAGTDVEGMTQTNDVGCINPVSSAAMALHNPYSPHPYYTYSCRGVKAGLTHAWNQEQMAINPWHGGYNNWRWGEPTALVVPPTAAFQTSYAWGVGQTRSTPIHHQFGRQDAGMVGGGEGMFANTPYWPSSTDQFGVYPVRAPW